MSYPSYLLGIRRSLYRALHRLCTHVTQYLQCRLRNLKLSLCQLPQPIATWPLIWDGLLSWTESKLLIRWREWSWCQGVLRQCARFPGRGCDAMSVLSNALRTGKLGSELNVACLVIWLWPCYSNQSSV